jgi:hypothetical protein
MPPRKSALKTTATTPANTTAGSTASQKITSVGLKRRSGSAAAARASLAWRARAARWTRSAARALQDVPPRAGPNE